MTGRISQEISITYLQLPLNKTPLFPRNKTISSLGKAIKLFLLKNKTSNNYVKIVRDEERNFIPSTSIY